MFLSCRECKIPIFFGILISPELEGINKIQTRRPNCFNNYHSFSMGYLIIFLVACYLIDHF